MCDEVIEETVLTNFNKKKGTYKTQNFFILLATFINYYIIIDSCWYLLLSDKISSKKKHLLPFHDKNNELKQKLLLPFHDRNNELKQKHLLPFHDTNNELKEVLY